MNDAARQLRLLFLAPFAPRLDAPHGGGRAIAGLIVQLATRHRVALQYLRGPGEPPVDGAVRAACDTISEVARPPERGLRHAVRLAAGLARTEPMWAAGWRVPAFERTLRGLVTTWSPDIVQVEYHVMGQYLRGLRPTPTRWVLRQHEPGTATADDRAAARRGLGRWLGGLDHRAWARYEASIMTQADAVVALTERDRSALEALAPRARITCIPLAAEIPREALHPIGTGAPKLVFVGNFTHPPNVDAAVRLARDITPRIRAQQPEVSLVLVGRDAAGRVARLGGDGVVVTGEVPDVRPFLDEAALVVVPLRQGGGMRVKVMEAMANGKAVLASPLAVEGLGVTGGDQIALAEKDDEFVAAACELLTDSASRARLGQRAREWATAHFGWERSIAAYETLYISLLDTRR